MIKRIVSKYFESFVYFYSYLRHRVFVVVFFSILIGVLDGFGLSMFLPLLEMVNSSGDGVDGSSLGKLQFIVNFIESIGFDLDLVTVLSFMVFFFLFKGVMQYISGVYKVKVQQWFIEKIRVQNVKGLNNLSYKYFAKSDVGRIQNTMTGEVERVAGAYFNYFKAFEYAVLVTVYMAFAFSMNSQFAVLVTIGGGLTNFLYKKLYQNTKGLSRELTGENNVFQSLVIQNVANYKYLKATGTLKKYGEKLKSSILKIKENNVKIGELDSLLTAGREPILIIVVATVIVIQTSFLGSDLGPILISLLFFYRALNYLMQMQVRWNKFLGVSGSLENMQEFGKELRRNKEEKGELEIKGEISELEFKDINFYYEENRVLRDLNLKIEKNKSIAFVGESGSGKTTLVNILAGLLPVTSGEYLVNRTNVNLLNIEKLQENIGYITQDPVIFNETIFNNVTFWSKKDQKSLDRFWQVIKEAALLDFVENLPQKEDTVLENNGANLSGGQRQRISIARELFKEIDILILDEATSALDSETEKAIQKSIDDLKGKYTVVVVAHRISTIKNADSIVIMNKGQIKEKGNYQELLKGSGYFRKLVELQEL
ncbi:ABC transporter ATP-binding protein [Salegentibacter chungangensis]|uniref:ABC transporter ATP-binding protein n=1 Tax=Salegentibacter chungangensis TaxID=1335724 RepID=A0ABW3NU26_9FLAO